MRRRKPADDDVNQIGNLLEKYKRVLKPPQASVEKECIAVIKELIGFELSSEQVSYTVSSKTLHLRIPSVLKSELKSKYPTILNELKSRLTAAHSPTTIL